MKRAVALLLVLLLCTAAFAKLPPIAVYVTGDLNDREKQALETEILNALVKSERFSMGSTTFTAGILREQAAQNSEITDETQIRRLGKQLGAEYICIVDVVAAFGSNQVAARILNIETTEIETSGRASGDLSSMQDLEMLSTNLIRDLGFTTLSSKAASAQAAPVQIHQAPAAEPALSDETAPKGPVKAAVYITGNPGGKILSGPITGALQKSGIYAGIESIDKYAAGATGDGQISSAGAQAGVHYVFVVDIAASISVRIVDVGTGTTLAKTSIDGKVSAVNAAAIAKKIVDFILKSGPKPEPGAQAAYAQTTENASIPTPTVRNFTRGQRWGTGLLNYLLPGVGSATIMNDWIGTGVHLGLAVPAYICLFSGLEEARGEDGQITEPTTLYWVGLGLFMGSLGWNIFRSTTYKKPASKTATITPLQGLNLAVFPDKDGNLKTYAMYKMEF